MVHSKAEFPTPNISLSEPLTSAVDASRSNTYVKQEEGAVEMPIKTSDEKETTQNDAAIVTSVIEMGSFETGVEVSDSKGARIDTDSLSAIEKSSRSVANGKNEGVDGIYQPGSKLEALDMSTNKWYSVKVVEVDWDEREVLIHFEKWSQRFDEWIPMNSSRLRPVGETLDSQTDKPSGYRVGETVMATWSDCRKYPARVKAILSGEIVEVLFFDGFVKRMKLNKISKCVGDQGIEAPFDFPLLPGLLPGPAALMSKAERREKKRKFPTVVELFQCKKTPAKKPKEPTAAMSSPRHASVSPRRVADDNSKNAGSEAAKPKAKYAELTASDNEGEKMYINLDASFTQEDGSGAAEEAAKKLEPAAKAKVKAKQPGEAKKGGGKNEKRKRSYNKVILDDSPAGTYRESYPFKGRRTNDALPPNDFDNWEPEGQEAYVVDSTDGLRRSIIVADDRLPEGWAKHTIQRRSGNSAGKWDVFLVSPTGRRFRSRKEMVSYFRDSGKEYKKELFDFTLRGLCKRHVKQSASRAKPVVAATAAVVAAATTPPVADDGAADAPHRRVKTLLPKAPSQQRGEGQATPPPPPHHPCTIAPPSAEPVLPPLDDGKVYVGTMEIQMQDNALVCPKEGCLKHFRRENLLQMHMKHYHPEYTQFLGSTPNVADLAYARTVGEPIEDIVPPSRTLAVAVNRFEASKKARQLAAMSPPPVLEPAEKKKPPPKKDAPAEMRKAVKTSPVEPKTAPPAPPAKELLGGTPLDLEQFIKPMKCSAQSTPLRDLLRKEAAPLRGPKVGVTAGIKTLLPICRPAGKDAAQTKEDWPGYPTSPTAGVLSDVVQGGPHKSRIRKRRLSDNYTDAHLTKKSRLVKPKSLDDSGDGTVASSSSASDDAGSSGFLTPASRSGAALKKKTPILAATLAQPVLDALDMSEPMGSPLTPLTPAELTEEQLNKIDIINCTCGVMEEDGLMIQCDLCLCWQHGHCNNIEAESQVPDKYVCRICLNPARQRASMRHLHDQAWLKEGALPTLRVERDTAREGALRTSHDLTATLLEMRDVVRSLRVKVNIADVVDHPKLYLWAKPWQKDTFDDVTKPELADLPHFPPVDVGASDDIASKAGSAADTLNNVDGSTLALAGGDNGERQDALLASSPQLDSQLLLQALTGGATNGLNNGSASLNNDLINELDKFPICQSELMRFAHSMADNLKVTVPDPPKPVAPEPEKPIDPVECRLLLLDHIQDHQQQVKDKLQLLEDQIAALEAEDPETLTEETVSFYPQSKQTIKMLLRDLTTVRNIAAIN